MPELYALNKFDDATPTEIEAALEDSDIVFFERCPIELPDDADLAFLRDELPRQTKLKNVSYHPESDSVPGFDASEGVRRRVTAILKDH
ncbi:MAG: Kdo hydroxylase family protein, partial [Gammaproteobacteria bacterium]